MICDLIPVTVPILSYLPIKEKPTSAYPKMPAFGHSHTSNLYPLFMTVFLIANLPSDFFHTAS